MFNHYIKIAFRNLIKYKLQSCISIIGLAVGFVCFSLSACWIQYEMGFDDFHPNANRICRIRFTDEKSANGLTSITPYPLASYLEKTFPEITAACAIRFYAYPAFNNEPASSLHNVLSVDSCFFNLFNVTETEGSVKNLTSQKDIVITQKLSKKLFGNTPAVGQRMKNLYGMEFTVRAVVKDWPVTTSFPFECITLMECIPEWNSSSYQTYILLDPACNQNDLVEKLSAQILPMLDKKQMNLTPLTSLHYQKPDVERSVKFNHLLLFVLSGLLVTSCALLNYLTLFLSRVQSRSKELALRKVNGSSNKSLTLLIGTEFLSIAGCAVLLGTLFTEWILPGFKSLSSVQLESSNILLQTGLYMLGIVCLTLICCLFPVIRFQQKTIQQSINGKLNKAGKNTFRKASLIIQLIISIGFIFCTVSFFKQIYHLSNTDLGFDRKNIGRLQQIYPNIRAMDLVDELKQIPSITSILEQKSDFLYKSGSSNFISNSWDGKTDDKSYEFEMMDVSPAFFDFYKMKIIQGKALNENSTQEDIVINEAALRLCGWKDPVGKQIKIGYNNNYTLTVIGVVKDFYIDAPSLLPSPIFIRKTDDFFHFVYKYKEGSRQQTEEAITNVIKKRNPDTTCSFSYMDDVYKEYYKSEQVMLQLLGFLSVTCLIISTFGLFSLVTLTCEQRRKEIAIRKINGANILNILSIFFKEYIILLIVSAVIAFPVGYMLIKPWIESFVKQTEINWWMYVLIILFVIVVISIAVFSRVWKAARTNPAIVIKSEQ